MQNAGCLPSIATIPIFIGLYNSLTNVAKEGLLDTEGFFWLPSLSGPSSIAARAAGVLFMLTMPDWIRHLNCSRLRCLGHRFLSAATLHPHSLSFC